MDYRIPNVNNRRLKDPHVVILGAGASIAACKIDKNGRELPVLRNMHKILDLEGYLEGIDCIAGIDDFELIYSKLAELEEHRDLVRMLENEVAKCFRSLELPDKITVFDYLILSLTEKDIIISFNWDPLLLQAYRRNTIVGNLRNWHFLMAMLALVYVMTVTTKDIMEITVRTAIKNLIACHYFSR